MLKNISPLLKNVVCPNKSMTRTFLPVGQGAFYSEHFYCGADNVFNMVYDCGSKTKGIYLQNAIDSEISSAKNTIDLLFVSHFHEDHINGIKTLMQKCKVKEVVIPAINKDLLICNYLHILIESKGNYNDSIWFLGICFSDPKAEQVDFNDQRITLRKIPLEIQPSQNQNVIPAKNFEWEYFLFCPLSGDWKKFIEAFKMTFPAVYNQFDGSNFLVLNDFFTNNPKNFGTLKDFYKNYYKNKPDKDDNHYSMTVLSKPKDFDIRNATCLYTGDYRARDKNNLAKLTQVYQKYWGDIKTFQVPHHGSDFDNPDQFYRNTLDIDKSKRNFVFSYGTDNTHHHPGGKIVMELYQKKQLMFAVTEKSKEHKQKFNNL